MSASALPLPSARELTPLFDEIIGAWHTHESRITDWRDAEIHLPVPQEPEWALLAHRLQLINTFQWHEEDRSRAHGAPDQVLAAVKRCIDASNRRRVQTIDALDTWIHACLETAGVLAADAPVPSETPASILDRLTILRLKIYHVNEALQATGDPAMHGRLETLAEQYQDLAGCFDRMQEDILAGRLRLKLYRQVKVYRDPDSGELRADVS